MDLKKVIFLPGHVRMNCLHMLEPKDFSVLCCTKSKYTFVDQFDFFLYLLEVLQCLVDLVV